MGLVKEVIKEIGDKSREFYEFVLPPVDMHLDEKSLTVIIDMPGFAKKDIDLVLCGNILSVKATKGEKNEATMICNQRPDRIDKKIRLPVDIKQGNEEIESARCVDGVLTLVIPIVKSGKDIQIE